MTLLSFLLCFVKNAYLKNLSLPQAKMRYSFNLNQEKVELKKNNLSLSRGRIWLSLMQK